MQLQPKRLRLSLRIAKGREAIRRGISETERRAVRGRILAVARLLAVVLSNVWAALPAQGQTVSETLNEREGKWVAIDRVEYGTIYLDTAQIVALEEDVFQVRTRWQFARVQTDHEGQKYRTSVALRAINCRDQEMAILAFADRDGRRVAEAAKQPLYAARWDPVQPGSITERIATWTCNLGRGTARVAASATTGG